MNPVTYPIVTSALASFMMALALVVTAGQHGRFTMDLPGAIQNFHLQPTPRVGGIGIYIALLVASQLLEDPEARSILHTILLAGIPALSFGLLEDLTKKIGVQARLAATMVSGVLACWVGGVSLTHLYIPYVDTLLGIAPVAILFTAFAVAGLANAINIIDGFHGLASGTTTLALLALAGLAALIGDAPLALGGVIVAAAVGGFWVVNFPWGKLFLGDGGAYFAGFALAWLAVLLPMRNADVSPWASFLVCAYPIVEVVYSVVRRRLCHRSPGKADRLHLHSLVATRIVQPRLAGFSPTFQNAAVSVVMWACTAVPALAALAFYRHTPLLVLCAGTFIALYHLVYRHVARK